jgi:hypothetical protein
VIAKGGANIYNDSHYYKVKSAVKKAKRPIVIVWLGTCDITGKKGKCVSYDDRSLRLLHCTFHFIIMRIIVNIGSTFSNHTNFLIKSIVQHISQGETLTVTEYYVSAKTYPYQKIEFALSKNRTLKSRLLQANPEATVVFLECPYY